MFPLFKTMLICLLCTIFIELILSILLKVRDRKDLLNVILVNILTNPIVVSFSSLILYKYGMADYKIGIVILEILAVITEGFTYKLTLKYKDINPFVLSLILNASSYGIGELINLFLTK